MLSMTIKLLIRVYDNDVTKMMIEDDRHYLRYDTLDDDVCDV